MENSTKLQKPNVDAKDCHIKICDWVGRGGDSKAELDFLVPIKLTPITEEGREMWGK